METCARKGLVMSQFTDTEFLPILPPQGFSLIKYFWGPDDAPQPRGNNLRVFQIHHRFSIVVSNNQIQLFTTETSGESLRLKSSTRISFDEPVIQICTNWPIPFENVMVLVCFQNQLILFTLDFEHKELVRRASLKLKDINSTIFVNGNTVWAISQQSQLTEIDLAQMKMNKTYEGSINLGKQSDIHHGVLVSPAQRGKECLLYYFFFTRTPDKGSFVEAICVKELCKTMQDSITEGELYKIKDIQSKKPVFTQSNVFHRDDIFWLTMEDEIVLIKKKHKSYYMMDTVRKKITESSMKFLRNGVLCGVSSTSCEFSQLTVKEPKCIVQVFDMILFQIPRDYEFFQILILEDEYLFLFKCKEDPFKIKTSFTLQEDAMTKVVRSYNQRKSGGIIEHMSKILGISKNEFYLKLWYDSNREVEDIKTKLLMCSDILKIKEEINMTLRKKATSIVQLIEIYTCYHQIVKIQLLEKLNLKTVKIAIQCHFLLRKLRIMSNQTTIIGLKEFVEIKNKGLPRMIEETIINERMFSQMCTRDRDRQRKINPQVVSKSQNVIRDLMFEMRYAILQNYECTLIEIIKPFCKDLEYIFQKFPFLLPTHPFSFSFISKELVKISSKQASTRTDQNRDWMQQAKQNYHNIFSTMYESEWLDQISIQEIKKHLLEHHPTSAVQDLVKSLKEDQEFKNLRLTRHGLLYHDMQEYISNVQHSVSGIQLYLTVIEFSNLTNLDELDLDQTVDRLIDIFRRKNNLNEQDLSRVKLYGHLHCLLLVHNFDPMPTMSDILALQSQQLISLFFLGNRHKISLIFNELKDIYDGLSHTHKNMFNKTLREFVNSDSCSPVELRLLVLELDMKGKAFQDQNQQLILTLIDGFCARFQVGEREKIQQLTSNLSNISLCLTLNQRIINMINIKDLDYIFREFRCENQTIYAIESEGKRILSLILEQYFVHEMYCAEILIEEQVISLESPRNMLNILLFLQQQLYSESVTLQEVIVLFGERLVDYEVFDVLRELIQEQDTLQTMGINPVQYAEQIIRQALYKLYREPGNFQQMKDHIYEILKLQVQETQFLRQQTARIQLCQLISDCNYEITPARLGEGPQKIEFMLNFIETAYQYLNVDKITEIYSCYQGIQGQDCDRADSLLLTYIALFAKTCIKNQKVEPGLDGVLYLLRMDCISEIKSLVTETFLQFISNKFPEQTNQALQIIQYFCGHQEDKDVIISIFSDDFDITEEYDNEFELLDVHQHLHYLTLNPIQCKLGDMRDISIRVGMSPKFYYRYYFFTLSLLMYPERLTIIDISYNILTLDDLVDQIVKKLSVKIHFVGVNFNEYLFRKYFLNVLCQLGCHLVSHEDFKVDQVYNFEDDLHFMNMLEKLKVAKQTALVKAIRKNIRYLQDNRVANENKERKAKKYEQTVIDQIAAITIQTNHMPRRMEDRYNGSITALDDSKRNMTLREFLSVTVNASMNVPILQAYEMENNRTMIDNKVSMEEEVRKQVSPLRPRSLTLRQNNFQQMETYLQQQYFQLFESRRYYDIDCKDKQEMLRFLKEYYYTDHDVGTFIKLLQGLKLGEERNIKIVQSAMRVNTPNIDLKKLFKFDFYFYSPDSVVSRDNALSSSEFYSKIFEYLVPSIMELMRYDTWLMLSKIVCVSLKFEKEYQYRVIMFALESFLADTNVLSTQFVESLNEFLQKLSVSPTFLAQHYKEPLKSCDSSDVQRYYLDMVLYCLKSPDQTIGRVEESQRELIEESIQEIQQFIQRDREQQ